MKGFSAVSAAILLCAIVGPSSIKCNTFKGAGQDIQAGGRGIQNVAEDAHRRDNDNRRHHTITAFSEENGSISPSGSVRVAYGADRTYTIAAYSGHHVTDVLVDGRSVGAVNRYKFNDIQANHTIDVLFDKNPHP